MRRWLLKMGMVIGLVLLLPLAVLAVTTNQPVSSALVVEKTAYAYDGTSVQGVPDNVLPVSMASAESVPSFDPVVELDAAKSVEQGRDALGRFLPKAGGEIVPGSIAEQAVWDAVRQKPGWNVIEGRVSVRNAAGDLRVYDGAAISPRGRVIGLEVKSGGATRTGAQSAFDSGINTFNPAVGVGQNLDLIVGRALQIRVP